MIGAQIKTTEDFVIQGSTSTPVKPWVRKEDGSDKYFECTVEYLADAHADKSAVVAEINSLSGGDWEVTKFKVLKTFGE